MRGPFEWAGTGMAREYVCGTALISARVACCYHVCTCVKPAPCWHANRGPPCAPLLRQGRAWRLTLLPPRAPMPPCTFRSPASRSLHRASAARCSLSAVMRSSRPRPQPPYLSLCCSKCTGRASGRGLHRVEPTSPAALPLCRLPPPCLCQAGLSLSGTLSRGLCGAARHFVPQACALRRVLGTGPPAAMTALLHAPRHFSPSPAPEVRAPTLPRSTLPILSASADSSLP